MDDLPRFRQVTRDYPLLQGLRQAPLALFIIGVTLKRAGLLGLDDINLVTFGFPLLFAMILLWVGIGWFYARTYGFVQPQADKGRKALTALFLVLIYAGFLVIEFGGRASLPVSLSGMFVGFLYVGLGRGTRRGYFTVFGALLVAEGLMPLPLGRPLSDPVFGTLGAVYGLTFGLGLLAVSLVDHIRWVRAFRKPAV